MQPMTPTMRAGWRRRPLTSRRSLPMALSSALPRTLQLFTSTRSALRSSATGWCPACSSSAVTASESRTFIWQP